jgi:hypothetical protein
LNGLGPNLLGAVGEWKGGDMSDEIEPISDGLNDNWVDRAVAATKGAAGLLPLFGGPLAEIIGVVVPGQRVDRIAAYVRELGSRVERLDAEARRGLASNAEKIDLIEEGGYQAARATSRERIGRIVEAVGRGLSERDTDIVRRKRLLIILGELDDDELNLLNAYGRWYGGRDRQAFEAVNRPNPIHMKSEREDIERNHLYELGQAHLLRLGLLEKNYGYVKKGQLPEFDASSGDFKHTVEISGLGRMLLKEVGLPIAIDNDEDA